MLFIFILPHHKRDWPKMDISELLRWPRIRAITIISTEIKGFGLRKEGIGEGRGRRKEKRFSTFACNLERACVCSPLAPGPCSVASDRSQIP